MSIRKSDIRSALLKLRENLDPAEAKKLSEVIKSNLKKLKQIQQASYIHTYVSSKKNEVDTRSLIEEVLKAGRHVVVPVTNVDHHRLDHSEILMLEDLRPGPFGTLEPAMRRSVDLTLLDVVIVPVVGVDRRGNRVGFGKGYYDGFLNLIKKPSIALAYSFQTVEDLHPSEEDVRVDFVVTEKEVIHCR